MPKILTTSIQVFDRFLYFIGFYSVLAGVSAFIVASSIYLSNFHDGYPRIWISSITFVVTIALGYLMCRVCFLVPIVFNVIFLFLIFLFVEDIALLDLPKWGILTVFVVVGLLFGGLISQPRVIQYQNIQDTGTNFRYVGSVVDVVANLFGLPTFGAGGGIGKAIDNANSREVVNESDGFIWPLGEFIFPTNVCTALGACLAIWFYPGIFGLVLFSSLGAMLGLIMGNIIQQSAVEGSMPDIEYPISVGSTFLRSIFVVFVVLLCFWLSSKHISLQIL